MSGIERFVQLLVSEIKEHWMGQWRTQKIFKVGGNYVIFSKGVFRSNLYIFEPFLVIFYIKIKYFSATGMGCSLGIPPK